MQFTVKILENNNYSKIFMLLWII